MLPRHALDSRIDCYSDRMGQAVHLSLARFAKSSFVRQTAAYPSTAPPAAGKWLVSRALRLRLASLALTLSFAPMAWAHKLNLFTYVEGTTVHVEGYFADGAKAKLSDVTALNSNQQIIAEGKTDENGEYRFQVPAPDDVQIVLNAGLGHQAQFLLAASEFGGEAAPIADAPSEEINTPTNVTIPARELTATTPVTASTPDINNNQLQAVVQRAVTEGIKPLAREIDALKNRTTLQDIVGGFGYIMGAFGIWAYLQARKQKRATP